MRQAVLRPIVCNASGYIFAPDGKGRGVSDENSEEQQLRHELANAQQQKAALQGLLARAADEIENLADADCEDQAKDQALNKAKRFKQAASL